MNASASAIWQGTLKEGQGHITTTSGALQQEAYSFLTRFEGQPGCNPEELIGAAHAACFSMALSNLLSQAGLPPEQVETRAEVTLDKTEAGPTITQVALQLQARVPGADEAKLQEIALQAKAGCPISRLLNADITLTVQLLD